MPEISTVEMNWVAKQVHFIRDRCRPLQWSIKRIIFQKRFFLPPSFAPASERDKHPLGGEAPLWTSWQLWHGERDLTKEGLSPSQKITAFFVTSDFFSSFFNKIPRLTGESNAWFSERPPVLAFVIAVITLTANDLIRK